MEFFTAAFLSELAEKSGDPEILAMLRNGLVQTVDQADLSAMQDPDCTEPQVLDFRQKILTLRKIAAQIAQPEDVVRFFAVLAEYRREDRALQG